jgi:hypothetical protein
MEAPKTGKRGSERESIVEAFKLLVKRRHDEPEGV